MSKGYHDPREIAVVGRHLGEITEKRPDVGVNECLVAIAHDRNGRTAYAPSLAITIFFMINFAVSI